MAAWTINHTLTDSTGSPKPLDLPLGEFFYGFQMGSVPGGWPADGNSVHISGMYPDLNSAGNPGACGEHARKGVKPEMAFNVSYTAGVPAMVSEPYGNRIWKIMLYIDGYPVLQPYAIDTVGPPFNGGCPQKKDLKDVGFAGLWPDLIDLESYGYKAQFGWRIRQANAPQGLAFLFLSSRTLPVPFQFSLGRWFLLPADPFMTIGALPVTLDTAGQGYTVPFDPSDTVRYGLLGLKLNAQAVVVAGTQIEVTNWCGMSF